MAKRTASKKAADDGSSETTQEDGITTQLRDLLRVGSPTRHSQTHPSLLRSRRGNSPIDSESWPTSVLVTVTTPTGERLDIHAKDVTIEFKNEPYEVTVFDESHKTYVQHGGQTFILKGKL